MNVLCRQYFVAFALVMTVVFFAVVTEAEVEGNPVEIGDVEWIRDFTGALNVSKESGKPVFLLFQEVPGCIGCQTFGSTVLKAPLLVEAIESEFIPVLVYNNRSSGMDAELLKRFNEPSWNFQVIRFLDGHGADIIPRKDQVWTVAEVASRMAKALSAAGREVPLYLQQIILENDVDNHATAGFAMACYWTGEYKLGKIEGVVNTEAGWYDNREITVVTYHRQLITLDALIAQAAREQCAQRVYLPPGQKTAERTRMRIRPFLKADYKKAAASDQKKQLESWAALKRLEYLSAMQLVKLNSFAPDDRARAIEWLSPRQRAALSGDD